MPSPAASRCCKARRITPSQTMLRLPKRSRRHRKPITLTERDRQLLAEVQEYGVMSTDHLHRLFFASVSRARKRLRRLWQHGFLNRHVRPVRMGEGSAVLLYTVTQRGIGHAMQHAGEGARPRGRIRVSLSEHALRIIDFHVALSLATRGVGFPQLRRWEQGPDYRFSAVVKEGNSTKETRLIPDAFFILELGGRDYAYFLEIDRGTTDLGRIKTKMLAYWNLWQSKAASTKLGIRSFRVLHVTTTERRLQNTLKALRSIGATSIRLDLFSLTCFTRYTLDHQEQLLEPIWHTVDQAGNTLTTCPFPGSYPSKLPIAPGKPPVCGT
jgi:hypothetical protein